MKQGRIHIYTGDGKGKTTASVGLAIRAYGRGQRVLFVQFLKGMETGERLLLDSLGERMKVCRRTSFTKFIWDMNAEEKSLLQEDTNKLFREAIQEAETNQWDMLVLDEVMAAITLGFIQIEEVKAFLMNKPFGLEVVLTGRDAPAELVSIAHYVSEIKSIKHPFTDGLKARKGIEF